MIDEAIKVRIANSVDTRQSHLIIGSKGPLYTSVQKFYSPGRVYTHYKPGRGYGDSGQLLF